MTAGDITVVEVTGAQPYDVVIGPGARSQIADYVGAARVAAVVCDQHVQRLAGPVVTALERVGVDVEPAIVRAGEEAKSLDTVAGLWDELARLRLTRSDLVVAVGGGATTDVAGFVAATWLRGIRVVHVPTTLLAMVDAAVGGKTGINTAAGKNLVGAFHPPAAVLVDLDVLPALPETEWVNGMAEVVKAGFIADPGILDLVERDPVGARTPTGQSSRELVERAIRMKAAVVSADLRESGLREILNYGHTLGHAIERVERYRWPHGHAVAVGMMFAAQLARMTGRLDEVTAKRHRAVLEAVGLPTTYPKNTWPDLREAMSMDKKRRHDALRFVLLDAIAQPVVVDAPPDDVLAAAFAEVAG